MSCYISNYRQVPSEVGQKGKKSQLFELLTDSLRNEDDKVVSLGDIKSNNTLYILTGSF